MKQRVDVEQYRSLRDLKNSKSWNLEHKQNLKKVHEGGSWQINFLFFFLQKNSF